MGGKTLNPKPSAAARPLQLPQADGQRSQQRSKTGPALSSLKKRCTAQGSLYRSRRTWSSGLALLRPQPLVIQRRIKCGKRRDDVRHVNALAPVLLVGCNSPSPVPECASTMQQLGLSAQQNTRRLLTPSYPPFATNLHGGMSNKTLNTNVLLGMQP